MCIVHILDVHGLRASLIGSYYREPEDLRQRAWCGLHLTLDMAYLGVHLPGRDSRLDAWVKIGRLCRLDMGAHWACSADWIGDEEW